MTNFNKISKEFDQHHRNNYNIFFHLITTILSIIIVLSFIPTKYKLPIVIFYLVVTNIILDTKLWMFNSLVTFMIFGLSNIFKMKTRNKIIFLVGLIILQELLHNIYGEPTYQSQYLFKKNGLVLLLYHTIFLLPLLLNTLLNKKNFGEIFVNKSRVIKTKLDSEQNKLDMEKIKNWVLQQKPTKEHTTHWWVKDLPTDIKKSFNRLARSEKYMEAVYKKFDRDTYDVDIEGGMNEIYVAAFKHNTNSDTVFYTKHIDGPFGILPFPSVYRTLIAVTDNEYIRTRFTNVPKDYVLTKGDVLSFDFNREIHYIDRLENKKKPEYRIILKVHHLIYPKYFKSYSKLYGHLSTKYDQLARKGFLKTIKPKSFFEQLLAYLILASTHIWYRVQEYIGFNNILYVGFVYMLSKLFDNHNIYLYLTSFVHYIIYISTYHHRKDINFGDFKRDALFYKTLALINIIFILKKYIKPNKNGKNNLPILLIIFGLLLTLYSSYKLGLDHTYFGYELGKVKAKWVTGFPYGTIPHPMIVGQLIAFIGILLIKGVAKDYKYYFGLHILFYIFHMVQEELYFRNENLNNKINNKNKNNNNNEQNNKINS